MRNRQGGPPVLCYHRIGGPLELGVTRASAVVFRRQMEALARNGWRTLTLAEFAAHTLNVDSAFRIPHSESSIPHSAFLLSFDDGYASLAQHAYPVLADLGFTATTFLITDFVGGTNRWDVPYALRRLPHLDWPTIERWRARRFDFQSHTARHPRLTWLRDAHVMDELERSRHELMRRLGADAGRGIAYPFGAVDERVAALAAAAGYELGFGGPNGDERALRLGRTPVYVWDRGALPLGLRHGVMGRVGRGVAALANRCAVGTSAMKRVWDCASRARGSALTAP
jgi:peptidoglycan/xylan/chitin deacetylase (PgdA/CDA1 family)